MIDSIWTTLSSGNLTSSGVSDCKIRLIYSTDARSPQRRFRTFRGKGGPCSFGGYGEPVDRSSKDIFGWRERKFERSENNKVDDPNDSSASTGSAITCSNAPHPAPSNFKRRSVRHTIELEDWRKVAIVQGRKRL